MNPVVQARKEAFELTLQSARRTMVLSETLRLAIDSFRASKLRFALTALGMVIGTASVILVVTIGLTGRKYILDELQKVETNSVELEYTGGGSTGEERVLYNDFLTIEDERAVQNQLPGIVYASPVLDMHDRISFGGGLVKDTLILGVSPEYRYIRNLLVPWGRFFDDRDEVSHFECAVVTEPFARAMFGSPASAIGRTFTIKTIPITIIGVFKSSVTDFGQSEIADQTVLLPYSVARFFSGTENVKQIYFSMRSMSEVPDAAKEIKRIVQSRHRPGSVYTTQTLAELLTIARNIANAITAVLVLVAAVTLAVGGVGIMNIMLANVRSRIREIGIRKALGATYREIKLQFLAEAVIISLAGGLVGVAIGLMVPVSIHFFTDYPLPLSWLSVVIALSAAVIVGIIFGTVPATRAAQLDPVDALKYE